MAEENKKNFEVLKDQALDPNMKVKLNYSRKTIHQQDIQENKTESKKKQQCPKCSQ